MNSKQGPMVIKGEEELAICVCGQSNHWPLCDASHHSLGGEGPEIIALEKDKTYLLCQCHRTKSSPFCDGSHEQI